MKCPKCVEEDEKSTVRSSGGFVTAMPVDSYYDEDGIYHSHDWNEHSSGYSCSRGHKWSKNYSVPCPASNCDFGVGETEVKFYD